VSTDGAEIAHDDRALSSDVAEGALVGEVSVSAYSLRTDTTTGVLQLRRGSGGSQESPVVDRVTALAFEYFAESAPPEVAGGGTGSARTTTYGPLPPPLDADNPHDAWPAGENCVFASDGVTQRPRLAALLPDAHGLTLLPPGALADGPWCPDGASPNRWDADLLRIRLVRVTLRVQAPSPTARRAPDTEVRIEVALRNRPR
jgi:hypothetical protein